MVDPWTVLGDFYSVLSADDRRGGAPFNRARNKSFIDTVDVCSLADIPFTGPKFTWARNNVYARLDRALVNSAWLRCCPDSTISHLHKLKSDHRPILLRPHTQVLTPNIKPFRFLASWLSHASFDLVLSKKWNAGSDLPGALAGMTDALKDWNKKVFGNIANRKRKLTEALKQAESCVAINPSDFHRQRENSIRSKLELVLSQEELMWVQKARTNWVVEGDRNTNFFHLAALKRRSVNRIKRLKDAEGSWVEDSEQLLDMVSSHFANFYQGTADSTGSIRGFSGCISGRDKEFLEGRFSAKEIQEAVKSMGPLKAPGKDGFGPIFYQHGWKVVGRDFVDFISRCLRSPDLIPAINETLITLIPKVRNPTVVTDFRPISLCNVTYKTITKCIANRIKNLMSELTHPSQTRFIPGRHITDNILMVQEVVHSLHTLKGKKRYMVIKLDLAKAYDKIEWLFVKDTIEHAGFPPLLVRLILECISSSSFQILWNGSCLDAFSPRRGLRQGCPLSPYIFTLCIERLSRMISSAVNFGYWRPIQLVREGIPLSHCFFADDLVLFSEADISQAKVILDILDRFCAASGQSINKDKSKVYFSKNVSRPLSREITSTLGIGSTSDLGRYLGVPILHGRVTKHTYDFILDRMNSRLAGWKAANLSLAGRVTLASSVLNSIPSYIMQTAFLPFSLCDKIDRIIRNFIWGSEGGTRKVHNVNWETVCKPKKLGGLGLRSAKDLNKAFLMKLVWNLISKPNELWAKVLISKYMVLTENGYMLARSKGFLGFGEAL
ncbi:LINE-1 retrotransposable element ORF2 protein [Linum perenne]